MNGCLFKHNTFIHSLPDSTEIGQTCSEIIDYDIRKLQVPITGAKKKGNNGGELVRLRNVYVRKKDLC